MEVFSTYRNSDPTEGRGPMVLDFTFSDREDAVSYIESSKDPYGRTRSWNGDRYGDWEIKPVRVLESLAEVPEADAYAERQRIRKIALAKLSDEEKLVLGIT